MVIGGWAVRANGHQRDTTDLDLLLACSRQNGKRVARAFGSLNALAVQRDWETIVATPGKLLAYPTANEGEKQADLLTSIEGINFDDCLKRSGRVHFGNMVLDVASRSDIIRMKQISAAASKLPAAKEKDLADIAALQALDP